MRDEIIKKLQSIEKENNVKILFAVESGSRAWGFESTDSDYDVRFIYAHPIEWYLSIEEKRDVITYPVEGLLDFHGWDVKKSLSLYKKSNPPLYEWLVSPIVYKEDNFAQQLRELAPRYYSLKTSFHNYLHMATGENKNYLQEEKVRIKDYFYVLRPLFDCKWIEKYKKQPPMEFIKMLEDIYLDNTLKQEVEQLLVKKKSGEEKDSYLRIESINNFADTQIEYFQEYAKGMVPERREDSSALDNLLFNVLNSSKS